MKETDRMDSLEPLRHRGFRQYFFANGLSVLGDQVVPVALAIAVLEATGSVAQLGLVLLARTLPGMVLVLLGGVWADRWSRKWMMIASDVSRAASQAVFAALLLTGHAPLVALLFLQVWHGVASAFFRPAAAGILPQLLPADQRQRGIALNYTAFSGAGIIGPSLAGVLVATVGGGWALAVDSLTFVLSALLLAGIKLPAMAPPTGSSMMSALAEGWREVSSRTWLWGWIVNFGFFQFAVLSALLVLGPAVSLEQDIGAGGWATIMVAVGVGGLIGSILAVRLQPARPLVATAVTGMFIPLLLLGLALELPLAVLLVLAFVHGAGMAVAGTLWESTLQANVPHEALSRVASYDWLGSTAPRPIGLALIGPISLAIGSTATLVGATLSYVALTAALLLVPDVRHIRREDVTGCGEDKKPSPIEDTIEVRETEELLS